MRRFIVLLLVFFSIIPCFSQEVLFDAMVIPSIADKEMDFWFKTPPNTGPQIPFVNKVYPHQMFMLLIFCRATPVDSQSQLDISYDLVLTGPDGKIAGEQKNNSYYKGPVLDRLIFANDHVMEMCFETGDSFGTYQIQMTFYENVSKRTFKISREIEHVEFMRPSPFSSDEEMSEWTMNYFQKPDPVRVFSSILYHVKLSSKWIKENGETLAFYRRIFQDNPFLWEYYAELYKTVSDTDKRKMLLGISVTPSSEEKQIFLKEVTGQMREFYDSASEIVFPETDQDITTPLQLDILWSEFLASGTYQPIKRIVSALGLKEYEKIIEKVKSGEIPELTAEIEKKFMLGAVFKAAEWSLISNCMQFHRVHQYCQTIYSRETLDPDVKEALGVILATVDIKRREEMKTEKPDKEK